MLIDYMRPQKSLMLDRLNAPTRQISFPQFEKKNVDIVLRLRLCMWNYTQEGLGHSITDMKHFLCACIIIYKRAFSGYKRRFHIQFLELVLIESLWCPYGKKISQNYS